MRFLLDLLMHAWHESPFRRFIQYSAHGIAFGDVQVMKLLLVLVPDTCGHTFCLGLSHIVWICEEY